MIIDILDTNHYNKLHAKGAVSSCLYNVGFEEDIKRISKEHPQEELVLMGWCDRTRETEIALAKLEAAGVIAAHGAAVKAFPGGLEKYIASGGALEGKAAEPSPNDNFHWNLNREMSLEVDRAASKVRWTGRNLLGSQHTGTLPILAGGVRLAPSGKAEGAVRLDVHNMVNDDIADEKMRGILIAHLRSDDFFETAKFPESRLQLEGLESVEGVADANVRVCAQLTLKGHTELLEFDALILPIPYSAGKFSMKTVVQLDRTKFGVLYGSRSFFGMLGGHFVNDIVTVDVTLIFNEVKEIEI